MARYFKDPMRTSVSLRVEQDTIDITSISPVPDKGWRYVDAAGHGHFYKDGYPTLHEVTETAIEGGEEWQVHVRWECPHCQEHIVPMTVSGMFKQTIPGMRRYFVNDEEVSRETFVEAWRPQAEKNIRDQEEML